MVVADAGPTARQHRGDVFQRAEDRAADGGFSVAPGVAAKEVVRDGRACRNEADGSASLWRPTRSVAGAIWPGCSIRVRIRQ